MSFDLGEFELCVVWIHLPDLLPCWCPQNLTGGKEQLNKYINNKKHNVKANEKKKVNFWSGPNKQNQSTFLL